MGGAKRLMEEQQAEYDEGLAACVAGGAIEECELHPGSYYEGSEDIDEVLEQADPQDRPAIQMAYDDNSGIDYCPSCDRNARD